MSTATVPLGTLLRDWRQRRRLSQLDLALEAGVSARHLSFLETGRSKPSREMVLHLSEQLDVPLRDRNSLLLAAGFAPAFEERPIDAPEMAPVRAALDRVLTGHEPFPAVVVDRWWNLAAANSSIATFTAGVPEHLMEPPVNVLRAGDRELTFFSTIATFGTALDITIRELAIESFFPADRATADALVATR